MKGSKVSEASRRKGEKGRKRGNEGLRTGWLRENRQKSAEHEVS